MRMIFHHPLPLDSNARAASGIRPLRMINAFKELGYQVDIIAGYGAERKKSIKEIKKNIEQGVKYDFVYAENSTLPTILTEPHRIPLYPLLDFNFFRFCNKKNIQIGIFYRDIYWLFESFNNKLGFFKSVLAKFAYYFELWCYNKTVKKLYLPSVEMGKYVPIVNPNFFEDLPPGHLNNNNYSKNIFNADRMLKLFYVGGMSDHYQMHELFEVIRLMPDIELTVCTREQEWMLVKNEYPELTENIHIIHKVGEEMEFHLKECDIALLFVKPQEYWEFAAPVKLYEYLGFNKPMIASSGTLAGEFVRDNNVGWEIPYTEEALIKLLNQIVFNPEVIDFVVADSKRVAMENTWKKRAEKVCGELVLQNF